MIHLSSLTLRLCFHRFSVHTVWHLELPNQLQTSNQHAQTSTWWVSLWCAPATGANTEMLRRTSNPPTGQGRLKALSAKGWAGLMWRPAAPGKGPGGTGMERAWDRMVALPELPWGQEPLKGTASAGYEEAAGPVWHTRPCVTLHHVAVTCNITQWPNIPWLYTRCSAEEVEY